VSESSPAAKGLDARGASAKPRRKRRLFLGAAGAILMFVLAVASAVFYLRVFAPAPRLEPLRPFEKYDSRGMFEALRPERVAEWQDRIVSLGNRFMAQPGHAKALDLLRQAYRDAGLEIYELDSFAPAPVTAYREISMAEENDPLFGQPLPDVEIFPFQPNHTQPVVTPEEGLTGELVLMTTETLLMRPRFDDCIGLIDTRDGQWSREFGFNWKLYAGLGVKALIVANPQGIDKIAWHRITVENNARLT